MLDITPVDASSVERIVNEMNSAGYASLDDLISPEYLKRAREYVSQQVQNQGTEYFALHGLHAMSDSFFADLAASPAFQELLKDVYRHGVGEEPSP